MWVKKGRSFAKTKKSLEKVVIYEKSPLKKLRGGAFEYIVGNIRNRVMLFCHGEILRLIPISCPHQELEMMR